MGSGSYLLLSSGQLDAQCLGLFVQSPALLQQLAELLLHHIRPGPLKQKKHDQGVSNSLHTGSNIKPMPYMIAEH